MTRTLVVVRFIEKDITAATNRISMKITVSQLRRLIVEALTESKGPLAKLAKGIKDRGTSGDFKKYCEDEGFEGVNQSCIDHAVGKGITFSKAKGGGSSLTYPKKD